MKKVVILEPFLNEPRKNSLIKSKEPNISTFRAITLLKKKFKVELIDLKIDNVSKKEIFGKIKVADFLFINVKSYNKAFCQNIIKFALNKSLTKVFVFGQIPSYDPALIHIQGPEIQADTNSFVSFIQGEFYNFSRFFIEDPKKYTNMKIINLKLHSDFEDIDKIPPLDIKELKKRKYYTVYPLKKIRKTRWAFMNLTEGCPHKCIFCSQTLRISHGKKLRHFSCIEAIKRIKRMLSFGFNAIRFNDDNFLCDKVFIKDLCKELIKRKIIFRWMAQVRADSIDEKTLLFMKKAGCESLNFGVESASDKILKTLEKGEDIANIKDAIILCKKHKILTVNYYMIGSPKERISDIKKTIDFSFETKPDVLQIAYFTAYEGSPFFEKNKEIILSGKNGYSYHYSTMNFNFSYVKKRKLKSIYKSWYIKYYFTHPLKSLRIILNMACIKLF